MDLWLQAYSEKGTISGACKLVGICRFTAYDWIEKYPDFAQKKDEIDNQVIDDIEKSLYQRAKGYTYTETHQEFDNLGNLKSEKKITKHIAPDVGAMVMALTNRRSTCS